MAIRSLSTRSNLAAVTFVYARETLGYIAVFVVSAAISYFIIGQIHLGSTIAQLVVNAGIAIGVTAA